MGATGEGAGAVNGRAGARGPVPAALGRLVSPIYGVLVSARNRRYDAGLGVRRLAVPVVSVGNLSVGGTGKTPIVAHLARALGENGVRPCIAMRGYTRRGSAESDEAGAYRRELPGVPVVVGPDRAERLGAFLATDEGRVVGCVLLDDGFQHRRLARCYDIVLVDATRSPFEDGLLPGGWLREPVGNLARADAVIVTHAESASDEALHRLDRAVRAVHGRAPIARTRHVWTGLRWVDGSGREETRGVDSLRGMRVLVVCAIGNPAPMLSMAAAAIGEEPAGSVVLRDHDPYSPSTVERIARRAREVGAGVILTTEKDWSKLMRLPAGSLPGPVARPVLEVGFDRGREGLLREVLEAVSAPRHGAAVPAR